jgi:uncharacterized membrane protein YeaQ/YmgE (transglycosylase-associated protein family)
MRMSLLDPVANRQTGGVGNNGGESGGDGGGSGPRPDRGEGLRDEYPRTSGLVGSAATGALWGFIGYTVLWQGVPFGVNRRFVESVIGTLVLLPVRTVLWGVHLGERMAGRPFEFADDNWWIGAAAAVVGGAIGALAFVAIQRAARALRR